MTSRAKKVPKGTAPDDFCPQMNILSEKKMRKTIPRGEGGWWWNWNVLEGASAWSMRFNKVEGRTRPARSPAQSCRPILPHSLFSFPAGPLSLTLVLGFGRPMILGSCVRVRPPSGLPGNMIAVLSVVMRQSAPAMALYRRAETKPAITPISTKSSSSAVMSAPRLAGERKPSTAKAIVATDMASTWGG